MSALLLVMLGEAAVLLTSALLALRQRRGWVAVALLLAGGCVAVPGGAAMLGELTNGHIRPAESLPWLAVPWAIVAGLVMRRRAAAAAAVPPLDAIRVAAARMANDRSGAPARSIFLSYRRSDSQDVAGRIYDRLIQHFGDEHVFKDVDSIPLGVDFRRYVGDQVARCDVLLAVIGPHWLAASEQRGRRLDDPRDLVRVEIASALKRDIPVVPVLVGGAAMPAEEALPAELRELSFRHGIPVRPDPDFHSDVSRLIEGLEAHR